MKSAIIALCLFACAYAVTPDQVVAQVLRSNFDHTAEGGFQYGFETDNGIQAQAEGHVKPSGKDEVALEITGSNQYQSPEGDIIALTYIANENGYQPQGAHLPTTPAPMPIPDYIAKAIEYIAAHPYVEKKQ